MAFEQFNKRPPLVPGGKEGMGVNLIGPIEFVNGLGTSTRGYHASLLEAGIPRKAPNICINYPIYRKFSDTNGPCCRAIKVLQKNAYAANFGRALSRFPISDPVISSSFRLRHRWYGFC